MMITRTVEHLSREILWYFEGQPELPRPLIGMEIWGPLVILPQRDTVS